MLYYPQRGNGTALSGEKKPSTLCRTLLRNVKEGDIMNSMQQWITYYQKLSKDDLSTGLRFEEGSVADYINALLFRHHMQPRDIILHLNTERSYTYQLLNGRRVPSRLFLLCLSLLLHLTLDETQLLIPLADRPVLYPKNSFDSIILWGILHRADEETLNQILLKNKEKPLS